MNPKELEKLLTFVKSGKVSVPGALKKLRHMPFESLDFATIDTHRSLRQGFPEVIFGQGKSAKQIIEISKRLGAKKENVLITRIDGKKAATVRRSFKGSSYNETARTIFIKKQPVKITGKGTVLVITAGTSDVPVAEEAAVTAECLGNRVKRIYDVGVAGIHRLLHRKDDLFEANVLIAVAGMEGALPSVVAGLVGRPVIAVPTSVGYGANLGGLTTLLAMLNSCSSGLTVVNIDNGFGAAYAATLINRDKK
ncbi:MAG: nickel pincer cofactor biosynthesis protein LarB [Deltaproteobacteria bacterium]|nr:nickel pincer cofactor biosynthesis protein LarB [Deltaproteobacteria bacterium]